MAKKKKEEPKADSEVGKLKVKEQPKVETPKKEVKEDNVTKVSLKSKEIKETVTKLDLNKAKEEVKEEPIAEIKEEVKEEVKEDSPQIEEVTEEAPKLADKVEQAIEVAKETGTELPEGIQKVVDFMSETGGDLNDYVKLNQDYSEMDNQTLLEEYYKQTKPHLSAEEREFLMEDKFSYDEEEDNEKQIKRKKLALKEQVADAKEHLDGLKSKYYQDVKSGSKLTPEQQDAINFYNEQMGNAKAGEEITKHFINKTNMLFNENFKGFEYKIGDKRFRYNVGDVGKVKENQKDINQYIGKFLDEDGKMENEVDYHKSLYTAMNADAIANHFYEQGKADALKQSIDESKNINMNPRQELNQNFDTGGVKMRAINDDASPEFKFKIKK